MKKDDVLHLHAALHRVRRSLEARGAVGDAFHTYDAAGVTPLSIHLDKDAHRRAVLLLAEALERAAGVANPPPLLARAAPRERL